MEEIVSLELNVETVEVYVLEELSGDGIVVDDSHVEELAHLDDWNDEEVAGLDDVGTLECIELVCGWPIVLEK